MPDGADCSYTGIRPVDSSAKGITYYVCNDDNRVAIQASGAGVVILTRKQAQAVVSELMDIFETLVPGRRV